MFVDFRQTFQKHSSASAQLPLSVVESLGADLPEKVRYYQTKDGMLHIGPEHGEKMVLGGLNFKITDSMRKALGNNFDSDDVLRYIYNAQKPLRIDLDEPDFLTINGKKVAICEVVRSAGFGLSLGKNSFIAYPEHFPAPFTLSVSTADGHYTLELNVKRVPNESAHTAKFESDPTAPFSVSYLILEGKDTEERSPWAKFNFSVHPEKCKTLSEVVATLSIFEEFANGSGLIEDIPLEKLGMSEMEINYDFGALPWFRKALEIEAFLGLSFNSKELALDSDTVQTIEDLYEGLVRGNPIKEPTSSATLKLDDSAEHVIVDCLAKSPSGLIALTYSRSRSYELFGQTIDVESFCGLFNLSITGIEDEEGGGRRVVLEEATAEGGYVSYLLFKNEAILDTYLHNVTQSDIMCQLQQAREPSEYVAAERFCNN